MKAYYLVKNGPAETAFDLRPLRLPEPGAGELLVRVTHFGLNYADVMARLGLYNDCPPLPAILGYEVVGHVLKAGSGNHTIKEGDRVLAFTRFGGYADHAIADVRATVVLNNEQDAAAATALATQYCTAWFAAKKMVQLAAGDKVLIHAAAGGVGTALVQIAKSSGCIVFGTAGNESKLQHLQSMGVDHPIDYRRNDFEAEVGKIIQDERLDVVFDPVGGTSFKKGLRLLGSGGRMVAYGASEWSGTRGGLIDKIRLAFGFGFLHPIGLLMKSKSVIGVNMLRIAENKPAYLQEVMQEVVQAHREGILNPVMDSVHPASSLAEAHTRLEQRQTIGKVAVAWT